MSAEQQDKLTDPREVAGILESGIIRRHYEAWLQHKGSFGFTEYVEKYAPEGKAKADFLFGKTFFIYRTSDPRDGTPLVVSIGREGEEIDVRKVWTRKQAKLLRYLFSIGKEPQVEILHKGLGFLEAEPFRQMEFRKTFRRGEENSDGES